MIETDLLKQLGWSEELINEVTRISKKINEVAETQHQIEEYFAEYSTVSGNSIHFYGTEIDTSISIRIQDLKK